MDESGEHHPQQTDTRTENETPHILTHKWVLNNENTWAQGGDSAGRGGWGGITLGEMPDIGDGGWRQQTTMACMYLCNNPARSVHVPQNMYRSF